MKVGAVDADKHQSLGGQYGVRGFPTIKIFGANKNKAEDYQGKCDPLSCAAQLKASLNAVIVLVASAVLCCSSSLSSAFSNGERQVGGICWPSCAYFSSSCVSHQQFLVGGAWWAAPENFSFPAVQWNSPQSPPPSDKEDVWRAEREWILVLWVNNVPPPVLYRSQPSPACPKET